MADYTGSDRRLAYLFANGGGGGGSCKVISGYYHDGDFYEDQSYTQIITGDTECLYIDLDTTTLYLFDGTDYVEVQGGGGGTVSDGTVGVEISVSIGASSSETYSFDDLGIVKKGYYLIACCSGHAETSGGWKWIGYMSYSAQQISYQTSYIKSIDYNNVSVTMNESGKTLTFANTNGSYGEAFKIQILPLHPKVEIPKHTYSTTEHVVGTWIDGKPIYECTFDLGSDTSVSSTSWYSTGITIPSLGNILQVWSTNSTGTYYPLMAYHSGGNINIEACRDGNSATVRWICFRYTKSTT